MSEEEKKELPPRSIASILWTKVLDYLEKNGIVSTVLLSLEAYLKAVGAILLLSYVYDSLSGGNLAVYAIRTVFFLDGRPFIFLFSLYLSVRTVFRWKETKKQVKRWAEKLWEKLEELWLLGHETPVGEGIAEPSIVVDLDQNLFEGISVSKFVKLYQLNTFSAATSRLELGTIDKRITQGKYEKLRNAFLHLGFMFHDDQNRRTLTWDKVKWPEDDLKLVLSECNDITELKKYCDSKMIKRGSPGIFAYRKIG